MVYCQIYFPMDTEEIAKDRGGSKYDLDRICNKDEETDTKLTA